MTSDFWLGAAVGVFLCLVAVAPICGRIFRDMEQLRRLRELLREDREAEEAEKTSHAGSNGQLPDEKKSQRRTMWD